MYEFGELGLVWYDVNRLVTRRKKIDVEVLAETDMYMVLPFPSKGSIPDDFGKQPIHSKKVGGGAVGSGDEVPFFAFDN